MKDDPLFGDVSPNPTTAPPAPKRAAPEPYKAAPEPDRAAPEPKPARRVSGSKPRSHDEEGQGVHTPSILPESLRRRLDLEVSRRNLERAESGEGARAMVSGLIREMIEAELPKIEKRRAR